MQEGRIQPAAGHDPDRVTRLESPLSLSLDIGAERLASRLKMRFRVEGKITDETAYRISRMEYLPRRHYLSSTKYKQRGDGERSV